VKIVVLGAGVAGLAVSARLSSQGHDVYVFEKNSSYGGKMMGLKKNGFYFDGGPSFFTDPDELRKLFEDSGKDLESYFSYFQTHEACRYFFGDTVMRGYDSPSTLAGELNRCFGEPTENVIHFLKHTHKILNEVGAGFIGKPFYASAVADYRSLKAMLGTPLGFYSNTMHDIHCRYFDKKETVKFFDRFATYVGSNPMRAPALLSSIASLEHVGGAYQPRGSMREIPRAMYRLSKDLGTSFTFSSVITRITPLDKGGFKVWPQGDQLGIDCDLVVNAGDVAMAYSLLGDSKRHKEATTKEYSASALVLYLGVKTLRRKNMYLHNIFFAEDYTAETKSLWTDKVPYHDPTIYVNYTGYFEKSHAPKGHQNLFVMINVPAGIDGSYIEEARKFVFAKLEKVLDKDIQKKIVVELASLTPIRIQEDFLAYRGAIYGQSANTISGAFFRQQNSDNKVPGLYHCGVTAHPGGGIPLALRSAKIVSEMIG
jgi:phytoene desaturase